MCISESPEYWGIFSQYWIQGAQNGIPSSTTWYSMDITRTQRQCRSASGTQRAQVIQNTTVSVVGIQLILQNCKYRLTLGTYNCCMTISTMHTIRTWFANTTRDMGYELVLSYPPPPPPLSQAHIYIYSHTHT